MTKSEDPLSIKQDTGEGYEKEQSGGPDLESDEIEVKSPFNFPVWKKWTMTVLLALSTATVTFGSSVFSATISVTSREFDVSETVMILGVSLFVLGFAVGPILWGPLSEVKGRRLPLFSGLLVFSLMQIPIALTNSLPAILVCRFLAGCFGASPIVLAPAVYADMWAPAERGIASAFFSAAVYVGPTLGPIIGSVFTENHLGWRWTAWITLIISATIGLASFLFVPETYAPVLRQNVAKKRAKLARSQSPSTVVAGTGPSLGLQEFLQKYLIKPVLMLVFEPMLMVVTLYISIVYGILYLTFYAYPYSFTSQRGWDPRIGTLPFLSILLGVLASSLSLVIYSAKYYQPRLVKRGSTLPEDRLPPMIVGSFILPIGLFMFAWTSSPDILWVPQVLSGFFIGAGIMLVFSCGIQFVVDIYLASSASALAANTCVRSFVAAGFPLAAPNMYSTLGTAWATSVLGFLCVIVVPAPILFYIYGHRLRQISRYAVTRAA